MDIVRLSGKYTSTHAVSAFRMSPVVVRLGSASSAPVQDIFLLLSFGKPALGNRARPIGKYGVFYLDPSYLLS